jgi:hypothetical protein
MSTLLLMNSRRYLPQQSSVLNSFSSVFYPLLSKVRNIPLSPKAEQCQQFGSFECSMGFFSKIGWWPLYPCRKTDIGDAISNSRSLGILEGAK